MTIAEKLTTIAENEQKVYDAGFAAGQAAGGGGSYEQGFADGKKSEYDRFWDNCQDYGNRTDYDRGFAGVGWTDETFKPKYKIIVGSTAYMMFANSQITEITRDTVDFSRTEKFNYTFYYKNAFEKIEVDCSAAREFASTFQGDALAELSLFNVRETLKFTSAFVVCKCLVNLVVTGTIGQSIDLSSAVVLTPESMKNVITHLKNYAGTSNEFKCTVRFTEACWEALEADSTSPNGGTWSEYVDSLGWLS